MRKHRISDEEASAVLRGQTPDARHDLASLADSVALFRIASFDAPPQPSAELAHRLELERGTRVSPSAIGMPEELGTARTAALRIAAPPSGPTFRRSRTIAAGLAGLGLAAKISLGSLAAAAVGISGAGVAGAVGVLPPVVQQTFDELTGHAPAAKEPVQPDDIAPAVTDDVTLEHPGKNASETGVERSKFGQETAEEARKLGEEKREEARQRVEDKRDEVQQRGGDRAKEVAEDLADFLGDKLPPGRGGPEND